MVIPETEEMINTGHVNGADGTIFRIFIVYVGTLRNKEVDFVAVKGDRIVYVQSTYMLVDKETIEREYSALEAISDHFEKIVVSLDELTLPLKGGIRHIQAWRLNEIFRN